MGPLVVRPAGGGLMTERDRPERPNPRDREIVLLRRGIIVAVFGTLATVAVAVWAVLDARDNAAKIVDALTRQLQSTQNALDASEAEKAAVESVSLEGFLKQYNAHVAALNKAAAAYDEAAKVAAANASNIAGSDRAGALTGARSELYAAADNFTHFVNLWRAVAEPFNKMLDGDATQLGNSRREDNAADVSAAAHRIVRLSAGSRSSAPGGVGQVEASATALANRVRRRLPAAVLWLR